MAKDNILQFKTKESTDNVIDLEKERRKRKKNEMSQKQFQEMYMKNSLVSTHGAKIMEFFNKNKD